MIDLRRKIWCHKTTLVYSDALFICWCVFIQDLQKDIQKMLVLYVINIMFQQFIIKFSPKYLITE